MKNKIKYILNNVSNQVINYRKDHHITQTRLAKESHIPQASIVRIEHGQNTSVVTLAKLSLVMNKSIGLNLNNVK